MAIKNLFGRGIGFGGPEWIPTHGYSIGAEAVEEIIAATGKYRPEHAGAFADITASTGFSNEHAGAFRDIGNAGS